MNILLIHQYAGNKGDRAVLFALVKLIKNNHPDASITVSTSDPLLWNDFSTFSYSDVTFVPSAWDFQQGVGHSLYWKLLHKIEKYTFTILRELYLRNLSRPFVRFLMNPECYSALKQCDMAISVGGHHFTTILSRDLVSSINYDAACVLSMGKKLVCFSQSFGPFDFHNNHNREFTKKILNSCLALYPREKDARTSLLSLGVKESLIHNTFETVLSLNSLFTNGYILPSARDKVVGVAIYATQKREPSVYNDYVNAIASFCSYVIHKGFKVNFFPMELKGTPPDDRILINDIISRVEGSSSCHVYDKDMNTPQHLGEVAKCRFFVGHKTHSTIFAMATGTPLIAIAYHPKTIQFMKQFGVEKYSIDDKQLSVDFLNNSFDELVLNGDAVGQSLFDKAQHVTRIIQKDLDTLLIQ